jgi:glutaredoxin
VIYACGMPVTYWILAFTCKNVWKRQQAFAVTHSGALECLKTEEPETSCLNVSRLIKELNACVLRIMLFLLVVLALTNPPDIKILSHQDCIYSRALRVLLDYSGAKYTELDALKHMNMLKDDKHIPKLYLNERLVGGYQDSLLNWTHIFKKLPEPPENLKDPEYVISRYESNPNINKDSSMYF